jgi:RND family efflux transporter MFP subunit
LLLAASVNQTGAQGGDLPIMECLIKPELEIELSSAVDGVLETVLVNKADRVSEGQLLGELVAGTEKAELYIAEEKARRDDILNAREVHADFMKRKKQQYKSLYAKKAVSAFDMDEVNTEYELAKLAVITAKNDRKLAHWEHKKAEAALALKQLRSPIEGVVVERYLSPGELVKERPILKLAKINPLLVDVVMPSHLFGRVKVGDRAVVNSEFAELGELSANVTVVDRVVDAASGTFIVQLTLPNDDYRLVGGLSCDVRF